MSELSEALWAVISERGCEASSLTYAAALALMRRLAREKVYGLCIVTNAAASRITHAETVNKQSLQK